jgi:glycolate oxidase FAD binding subunit
VIDYPAADMTITVEAGITLAGVRRLLAQSGQRLPLDPPQAEQATIGGIFATNATGPRRFGLGRPRDTIIGVEFATAAGVLVKGGGRVVKNVAGYDFPKLMTGSMGTLGILTQLTLKVRPIPEATALVWAGFDSLEKTLEACERLNLSGTRPVAVELINAAALKTATGESASFVEGAWALALGFEGNRAAVVWQTEHVRCELESRRMLALRDEESTSSWSALEEFCAHPTHQLSLLATVPPSALHCLLSALHPRHWQVHAHAGSGIVFASRAGIDALEGEADVLTELNEVRKLAVAKGGNLTLPHCPTRWKARAQVWGAPRADGRWMQGVKDALDPLHVLNPGRFVGRI